MPKAYAQNRKALHDYEILDKFEAGLVLTGPEVKSIQNGKMTLPGSMVKFISGKAQLVGAEVPPYQIKNTPENYNPTRSRDLLLKQNELKKLHLADDQKELTIIPISVYNKHGLIKIEIAIAKLRKKADKREALKKKSAKREMRQAK